MPSPKPHTPPSAHAAPIRSAPQMAPAPLHTDTRGLRSMSRPFCRPAFQTPPDFHGRTLVLPVISVGSVPQLAVDLLIHAPELQCARVASLDGAECVPFVAPSEDGSATAGVYTALDGRYTPAHPVYQAPGSGLVIVQQRSPVLKVGGPRTDPVPQDPLRAAAQGMDRAGRFCRGAHRCVNGRRPPHGCRDAVRAPRL